jgi:hypothetical protein
MAYPLPHGRGSSRQLVKTDTLTAGLNQIRAFTWRLRLGFHVGGLGSDASMAGTFTHSPPSGGFAKLGESARMSAKIR